jgi:uncharacterized protein YjdB
MLKFYRNVLAAGVVALGLAACGDNVTVQNPITPTPLVHSVTVVPVSVTASVGQAVTFVASVNADSGLTSAVSWVSTNPAVATVTSAGVVTALTPGQTTIVATSSADPTKTGAGSLTVVALPPGITSFTVTPTNATLGLGFTVQVTWQISPASASPTVTWASNNTAVATVSSTGLISGVSAGSAVITATATVGGTSVPATVGVTVVATSPPGVVSFAVTPSSMSLAPGQSSQASATAQMLPGFTAPTVTWTSLAPAIATVSSTGLITGVAQGSAVVTASITGGGVTLSGSVAVTVGAAASISIAAINAGATAAMAGCAGVVGAPVILTNVNCQIDVMLNLTAGVQSLDSLNVYLQKGIVATGAPIYQGRAAPVCGAASCPFFRLAAQQRYGNTIPSTGPVTLSINTANFTKNPTAGTAVVDWFNGPTALISQVFPHNQAGGQVFNCQIGAADPTCVVVNTMIFNNTDGWSADVTKCSAVIVTTAPIPVCPLAVPASGAPGAASGTGGFALEMGSSNANPPGTTYWGGPGVTGQITAELYAVVYNDNPSFPAGSSANICNNQLGNGTGCISSVSWSIGSTVLTCPPVIQSGTVASTPAFPFRVNFGTSGAGLTAASAGYCFGHENILAHRDNVVVQVGALDAQNNTYPATPLIPNTVVYGATPDSFRLDWKAPSVGTPSIARTVPAVTGWVNASFSFVGFSGTDAGVGPAPLTAAAWWSSVNCPGVVATNVAMLTQTGADINGGVACPTNFIGGTPGLGGTAPWTVTATETDLLGNQATSGTSSTFGTDYTAPVIRWGLVDPAPLVKAYGAELATASTVDSAFGASTSGAYMSKPIAGINVFRAEYLDDRSGFYNIGQPDGGGVSAQAHQLSWANHIAPTGACSPLPLFGTGPVGATFVTNPSCGLVSIAATQGTLHAFVRLDGWQPGIDVNIPTAEAYYGYKTNVTDAAGNVSVTLLRRVLVNTNSPFSTGLGIPAVLTNSTFNFLATASDSAELSHQSLQIVYPNAPVVDSLRYARVLLALSGQPGCGAIAVTAYMDDCISSPFAGIIQPVFGTGAPVVPLTQAPYVRGIEIVDGTAFGPAATNTSGTASFATAKPTKVLVWAWNWGGAGLPAGFPAQPGNVAPTASTEIAIPALNVQTGANIAAWNVANPTIAINYWRVITTVGSSNQFGSTVTLRAQVTSPTDSPNPPFTRVDFYRLMDGPSTIDAGGAATHWNYLGSTPGNVFSCAGLGVCASDQGTYRSWIYQLPNSSFVNAWNSRAAQAVVGSTNRIIAVGVVSTGDALSTLSTTMIP